MNIGNQSENNTPSLRSLKKPSSRFILTWIVPVLIVVLALAFAKYQMATRPKAQRQKPPQQARLIAV